MDWVLIGEPKPYTQNLIHLLFRITWIISNFISQVGKQVWMIKQSAWGHIAEKLEFELGLTGGTVVKNLPASVGDTRDTGSIPGLGRYRSWQATVHGVVKSRARLSTSTYFTPRRCVRTVMCQHRHCTLRVQGSHHSLSDSLEVIQPCGPVQQLSSPTPSCSGAYWAGWIGNKAGCIDYLTKLPSAPVVTLGAVYNCSKMCGPQH